MPTAPPSAALPTPPSLAHGAPPVLEEWYRRHLLDAEIDISSSGVSPYTLGEVRALTDLSVRTLDDLLVDDSQSLGAPGLRRALADVYAGGRVDNVMATHGSSEAIFLVLSTLCGPGRRVVCLDPAYHSLVNVPRAAGAEVVALPLGHFVGAEPDWESIEAVITADIDVVIVNFPHNPTGTTLSPRSTARLADLVARRGAYLVWDAALEHLTTGPEVPGDLGARHPRSVVLRTMSKAFGLPGLRVGWVVAPPEVLERTHALHDSTTLFLSPLVEEVATHAVLMSPRLRAPRLARATSNRGRVARWVEQQPGISWSDPAGGVTALVHLCGVDDVESFCLTLLAEHGVLLVPGTAFGAPGSVRLGFGGDSAELDEGLRRLAVHCQEFTR